MVLHPAGPPETGGFIPGLLQQPEAPTASSGPRSVAALLHHLCEAVGDAQGGVDEPLHTVLQTCLCPVVQLGARAVHALIPANVGEVMHLEEIGTPTRS